MVSGCGKANFPLVSHDFNKPWFWKGNLVQDHSGIYTPYAVMQDEILFNYAEMQAFTNQVFQTENRHLYRS
jgi:hypothetical protein